MSRRTAEMIPTRKRGLVPSVHPATPGIRLGVILDVDTENNTAVVSVSDTESTGVLAGVPWLSQITFPNNGGGLNAYPMRGSQVIIASPSNQFYVIIGSLHAKIRSGEFLKVRDISYEDSFIEPQEDPDNPEYKIRTGNRESVYQTDKKRVRVNAGGLSSRDLHSGDVEMSTPDNSPARLGVYRGGVVRAKASNLAQILLTNFKSLVRIISRNFQLFSDAGRIEASNKEDVTSFEMRFGNSFKDETHPSKELWRYRSRVGGDSNVVETIVSEPTADGEEGVWDPVTPLYKSTIDKAGAVGIETVETVTATAIKDISLESSTANINTKAALNIVNEAGVNIENTATIEHKITATKITSTATTTSDHKATATYTIGAPFIRIDGTFLAVNPMTQFNQSILIHGSILGMGGPLIISSDGGLPDALLKATALIEAFNFHTHFTAVGSSSTPSQPLFPSGDLLTTTLIG